MAALAEPRGGEPLGQGGALHVGVELEPHEPPVDRAARRDPADAQPAADRLGQRVDVDDVRRGEAPQARALLAVEGHRRVDAVLEDEEAALAGQRGQAGAARVGEVGAGRVVAGGLQGDEPDLVAGEDPLERVDVEAVLVDRHAEHARAGRLQRGERAGERRRLDDRDVARSEDRARDEVDRLAGPGRDDDLLGLGGEAARGAEGGQLRAQRRQALDLQVLQAAVAVGHDRSGEGAHLVRRQHVVGRESGGERDRVAAGPERLGEHLLGVAGLPRREHAELPVLVVGAALDARVAAHEGAAADVGGDVALLGEPAVDARRRQVVDRRLGGEVARRRQLGPGPEKTALDVRGDALGELRRQRAALAIQVGQINLV